MRSCAEGCAETQSKRSAQIVDWGTPGLSIVSISMSQRLNSISALWIRIISVEDFVMCTTYICMHAYLLWYDSQLNNCVLLCLNIINNYFNLRQSILYGDRLRQINEWNTEIFMKNYAIIIFMFFFDIFFTFSTVSVSPDTLPSYYIDDHTYHLIISSFS